jgi:hypothetical protein
MWGPKGSMEFLTSSDQSTCLYRSPVTRGTIVLDGVLDLKWPRHSLIFSQTDMSQKYSTCFQNYMRNVLSSTGRGLFTEIEKDRCRVVRKDRVRWITCFPPVQSVPFNLLASRPSPWLIHARGLEPAGSITRALSVIERLRGYPKTIVVQVASYSLSRSLINWSHEE